MNNSESIPSPEEETLSKEALLATIESSRNLKDLYDIVSLDDFDAEAAQIKPPFIGGVRLVANENADKVRWASLRFEQKDDEVTAYFDTSSPLVRSYVLPQNGRRTVKLPYSKPRRVNVFNQVLLSRRLEGLEVFKPR